MTSKVKLSPEQETMLITLYAKAQPGNPLFFDPMLQDVLARVDYDYANLNVPYKTVILVSQRAKKIDSLTQEFLAENPDGVVIQLGCGLDNRFWRVDNGLARWYDLDMPPVIKLRQQLFPENERYQLISSSVTDLEWIDTIAAKECPVLVIAEGLLMYLTEDKVQKLVLRLHERFPGAKLIADVFSKMTARSAAKHPSLKKTGATIGWGLDEPTDVEAWGQGIKFLYEWYFSDDPDLEKLGFGYRLAYKLAGAFKMAQRAHRIAYFQL